MNVREWADRRNEEWARQLRQASLVAEVDADDDDVDKALKLLGAQLRLNQLDGLVKHHPALLLVALTHAGMRGWEEGTFYDKVAGLLAVHKAGVEDAVKGYHRALSKMRLPLFDDAKGMRWVTPVLLHGAIPLDHLDELLDLLATRRRRDPSVTGESFVEWARHSPRELENQPRALTRFIEFGGDFAPDYVGRVIDLIDGNDVVLPRRSVERLRELLASGRGRSGGTREARPVIAVSRDGGLSVRLPAVRPTTGREVTWRVQLGDLVVERDSEIPWDERASKTRPEIVQIGAPVRDVVVERDGAMTVLPFVRKEDPLLVFDDDGDLVPATRPVPAGRVRLMWPGGDDRRPRTSSGTTVAGRDMDVPYGWEGWSLLEADLDVGTSVRLGDGAWHRVAGADRARIVTGPIIEGVHTSDGYEVAGARPVVELPAGAVPSDWAVTVADTDGILRASHRCASHSVPVPGLGDQPFVGDLTITVRGPLGRGIVRRVVVAEELVAIAHPDYRGLAPAGGLVDARVIVRQGGRTIVDAALGQRKTSAPFELSGRHFIVDVPHPMLSLVRLGVPGEWTTEPQSIETSQVAQHVLSARGLQPRTDVRLALSTRDSHQELTKTTDRRGAVSFPLATFDELAKRLGSAVFVLDEGSGAAPVVRLRPGRLVSSAAIDAGILRSQVEVAAPVEAVLFRAVAPWEPGSVVALEGGLADLPAELVERGTLRAWFRVEDEWGGAAPTGNYPPAGADVVDLLQGWDLGLEPPETRAVSLILGGRVGRGSDVLDEHGAARAVETLAAPGVVRSPETRARLSALLIADPQRALSGFVSSTSTTPEITGVLVESGLVDAPIENVAGAVDVEVALARSPLLALLTSASALSTSSGRGESPGTLLVTELGDDLEKLWRGEGDDSRLGSFEPSFEQRPEQVAYWYEYLDPVPGLMLDGDTRVACVYELWQARGRLRDVIKQCAPTIGAARRVIEPVSTHLWDMVKARDSGDGALALPALSVALALVSRLAARRGGDVSLVAADRRPLYAQLARHAPGLVAVDLVRADAAVIGAVL